MTVIIRKNSWRFADGSLLSEEEKDKLRKEMSLELETDLKDTGWQGLLKSRISKQIER